MPSILTDIRVLSRITRRPQTTHELVARLSAPPQAIAESLRVLRDEGAIACTNGVWWRRETVDNGRKT